MVVAYLFIPFRKEENSAKDKKKTVTEKQIVWRIIHWP